MTRTPVCLSIATSDSGGGAGIQADVKAFAAAGCHGATVVVALTAQSTQRVVATCEVPLAFITAQLDAVFSDLTIDALKTGALVSRRIVETVAGHLAAMQAHGTMPPLVIDPVLRASSGAALLADGAVTALRQLLLPLATVVTPNRAEAVVLAGGEAPRHALAERIAALGARAVIITGGDTDEGDHLFDGRRHVEIAVNRVPSASAHGSGCTHSATLCAELAQGADLESAARRAAAASGAAIARGLGDVGGGSGPVDVLGLRDRRDRR